MVTLPEKIRVLVADDHAIVRAGVRLLIETESDMTVVGEAENGEVAIALAKELNPDVILMDITMPNTDGIKATRRIKQANPDAKVLVLTRHDEDGYLQHLINAGADGYVLKQNSSSQMIDALRVVFSGRSYIDHSLTRSLIMSFGAGKPSGPGSEAMLNPTEESVLRLVAFGNSYKEIAVQLAVSTRTVEHARKTGMNKMGFESRVDIVRYAVKQGWMHDN